MDKKTVAEFLYEFITSKYDINDGVLDKVTFCDVVAGLKAEDNGHFTFNCHEVIEAAGITIDQFKKDFAGLITIFSRVEKSEKS